MQTKKEQKKKKKKCEDTYEKDKTSSSSIMEFRYVSVYPAFFFYDLNILLLHA